MLGTHQLKRLKVHHVLFGTSVVSGACAIIGWHLTQDWTHTGLAALFPWFLLTGFLILSLLWLIALAPLLLLVAKFFGKTKT